MLLVLLQNNKNLCHNVIFYYPMVLITKESVKLFKASARGELLLPHVSLSNQGGNQCVGATPSSHPLPPEAHCFLEASQCAPLYVMTLF